MTRIVFAADVIVQDRGSDVSPVRVAEIPEQALFNCPPEQPPERSHSSGKRSKVGQSTGRNRDTVPSSVDVIQILHESIDRTPGVIAVICLLKLGLSYESTHPGMIAV